MQQKICLWAWNKIVLLSNSVSWNSRRSRGHPSHSESAQSGCAKTSEGSVSRCQHFSPKVQLHYISWCLRMLLPKRESLGVILSHDDTGLLQTETELAKSGQLSRETWNVTACLAAWLTRKRRDKRRNGTKSDFTHKKCREITPHHSHLHSCRHKHKEKKKTH